MLESRKPDEISVILLFHNSLKKEIGMKRMKTKETRKREHKDLQVGQIRVIFKRVGIHRCYSHVV